MTLDQLDNYLASIPRQIDDAVPDIIAETGTEYFKGAFTEKSFDNNPWEKAKTTKNRGSLLVDSGNLVNSIHPAVVSKNEVIFSAGNSQVNYAQVHNEGFTVNVTIPAHTRNGHQVKSFTRKMDMPARPFMAKSRELNDKIMKRIEGFIKSII